MKRMTTIFIIVCTALVYGQWTPIESGVSDNLYGTYFLDDDTGFAVGWGASSGAVALKTTNGGEDWNSTILSNNAYVFSVTFTDSDHGYAAGCLNAGSSGAVFKTSNGGSNWSYSSFPATYGMYDVEFTSSQIGYTCGWLGKIYKTVNGGTNWTNVNSGTTNVLRWMSAVDEQNVFIVGGTNWNNPNKLFKTTDGTSFSYVHTFSGSVIGGVHFFDETIGVVAGGNSGEIILKTYDGGESWEEKYTNNSGLFQSLSFKANGMGYACGNNGRVLYSGDFGESWIAMESVNPSSTLLGIYAASQIVYTVGYNGDAFKHEAFSLLDADFSVDVVTGSTPLTVQFSDESIGNPVLWWWDFDDNGALDSFVQNPEWTFSESGEYTISLTVSDGINEDTETKINYVNVTNTNAGDTVNPVSKLIGNFPNPFNPTTTIMFELSPQNMKNAKLEILNSKGQTVRTFSADNHPNFLKGIVVWDGKDEYGSYVSSGMYFCNLNSEEYSESKKMILLK
jgi:photosystem II stability/assembly factor-like uncharacterized protein